MLKVGDKIWVFVPPHAGKGPLWKEAEVMTAYSDGQIDLRCPDGTEIFDFDDTDLNDSDYPREGIAWVKDGSAVRDPEHHWKHYRRHFTLDPQLLPRCLCV